MRAVSVVGTSKRRAVVVADDPGLPPASRAAATGAYVVTANRLRRGSGASRSCKYSHARARSRRSAGVERANHSDRRASLAAACRSGRVWLLL